MQKKKYNTFKKRFKIQQKISRTYLTSLFGELYCRILLICTSKGQISAVPDVSGHIPEKDGGSYGERSVALGPVLGPERWRKEAVGGWGLLMEHFGEVGGVALVMESLVPWD